MGRNEGLKLERKEEKGAKGVESRGVDECKKSADTTPEREHF